ncbi:MAG: hypothetical protein C0407_19350 [Desulfobacca sp.]|nr:hypothetical protein [Desulfobacca sp.]
MPCPSKGELHRLTMEDKLVKGEETMRILIVDDNQSVATVLRFMLEPEGFEIKLAQDGDEGYSTYKQFQPDLVITDIQMPGENGFELMNHIWRDDPTMKTIYMSGDLSQYYPMLNRQRGTHSVSVLNKPFSRNELINMVFELLDPNPILD